MQNKLKLALQSGMSDTVPPDPQFQPPKAGEPPLHRAARLGDAKMIRELVEAGADINASFDIGLDPDAMDRPATPLMVAAGSGDGADESTVRLLLDLGADASIILDDSTAATFAFEGLGWWYKPGGDAARASAVLAAGSPLPSDLERCNKLLCDTAATGDSRRVSVLLAQGLNANGYWDAEEARKSHLQTKQSLESYRASQPPPWTLIPEDVRSSAEESIRKSEQEMFERMSSAPSEYEIPLFRAAESGNAECVRVLLAAGADPKMRDNSKRSAMYSASSVAVVHELRSAGIPLEDRDEYGWSPLKSAVIDGESALPRIRALIQAGANVNATHDRGYTVFMCAVGSGRHPEVLRLLVAAGADPHAVSELGYTAYHAAIDVNFEANAETSVRDTLGYLKELGVDIERRTLGDLTPLARAIQDGNGLEVRVLCELGANPNAVCPKHECGGESCTRKELPLLFHASDGIGVDKDIKADALLRVGADPLAVDANGFTAFSHVIASLCQEAADYADSYRAFVTGFNKLPMNTLSDVKTRDEFIQRVTPILREYTEKFAAGIPIKETCEFSQAWHTEKIACLTVLGAYEVWARSERGKDTAR